MATRHLKAAGKGVAGLFALAIATSAAMPPSRFALAQTSADSYSWVAQINAFRAMARLDPVEEDPKLSAGDLNHARYLVKRFEVEDPQKVDIHSESRDTQWSTPSGAAAASLSNIAMRAGGEQLPDEDAQIEQVIHDWMTDPFERLPILDPDLRKVGLGFYRERDFTSVVLQVRNARRAEDEVLGNAEDYAKNKNRAAPPSSKYPIMFPPEGSNVSMVAYESGGYAGPLAVCPGYGTTTGLPITLELGPLAQDEKVNNHSVTADGKPLEHCIFVASTYEGFDEQQTVAGRLVLTTFGAIVIVPRMPLHSGKSYTVSIDTSAKQYKWSFTVK